MATKEYPPHSSPYYKPPFNYLRQRSKTEGTFTPAGDTKLIQANIESIKALQTALQTDPINTQRTIEYHQRNIQEMLARSGSALEPELVQSARSFLPPPSTE